MESHNFRQSLCREKTHQKCADDFYVKRLNVSNLIRYNNDTECDMKMQRRDIDVSFQINNKLVNVSEKFREKDFNDLYIEFYSKFPDTPGWLNKSHADYMAYFFPERVFFINEKELAKFYENDLLQAVSNDDFSNLIEQNSHKNAQKKFWLKVQNHHYRARIIQAYNETKDAKWYTMGIAVPFRILSDFGISFKEFGLDANSRS